MAYKIALTTSNGSDVDLHFGQSTEFQVFQVHEDTGAWEFLEQRNLNRVTGPACAPGECPDTPQSASSMPGGCSVPTGNAVASCAGNSVSGCGGGGCGSGQGHGDERIQAVIDVLSDCNYILTAKIGPKPQAALRRAGITALESPADLGVAIAKLNTYHNRSNKAARA